jgi:hypothetical protein
MSAVTFDTLKFVKTLKGAGVSEAQAEAFSTAVRESHEAAELATKRDIDDLRKDMEMMRKDIIIKLGSIIIGAVTVIPLLLRLLHLS